VIMLCCRMSPLEGLNARHFIHFISYSLGCGASCDSSDILAGKHRCMWCATKASWLEFYTKKSLVTLDKAVQANCSEGAEDLYFIGHVGKSMSMT